MSFSLLRTNVALTSNVKIMIDSKYKLYLESIDSNIELSNLRYKKFIFNKDNYYDEILPVFFKDTPSDISFSVKYDDDNDNMYTSFDKQYDDTYQMGARNIYNNKGYDEEFEYFSPLYLDGNLPSNFIIFRVDGTGIINLNKNNFRNEIIDKLKVVKTFDLSNKSTIGQWIYKNFVNNQLFPKTPAYIDFRDSQFSTFNGVDLVSGGYTTKSVMMDPIFDKENTFSDLEFTMMDMYKGNNITFPNILNLSYLFDDTPGTPTSKKEWSLNRYLGFYIDEMEVYKKVSLYIPNELKSSVNIVDNFIVDGNPDVSTVKNYIPFVRNTKDDINYIEVAGDFYELTQVEISKGLGITKINLGGIFVDKKTEIFEKHWKILSNKVINASNSEINRSVVKIDTNGIIKFVYGATEEDKRDIIDPVEFDKYDLWLIDLGNEKAVVKRNTEGYYYINSDYGFDHNRKTLEYYIDNKSINNIVDIHVDKFTKPVKVNIYRCKFTDIKDFDTSVVDTSFSKFEYDINDTLIKNDETKLYYTDFSSTSDPKEEEDFKINGIVENIPVSSEYTANGETFRIVEDDLSKIWRKNSLRVKWGYKNSISSYDYPYLLNNSFISEDFNRSVNVYETKADRQERTLDYFYSPKLDNSVYDFNSLHTGTVFDLNKYLELDGDQGDYFSKYFSKSINFKNGRVNGNKWAVFNSGDNIIPNSTVFRGIKFNLYDVDSIKTSNGDITDLNIRSSNLYSGYKVSVLLTENDKKVVPTEGLTGIGLVNVSYPESNWIKTSPYEQNITYNTGDIVTHYGLLWTCVNSFFTKDPKINPANSTTDWVMGTTSYGDTSTEYKGIWDVNSVYSNNDIVYYGGEYYKKDTTLGSINFWNPTNVYNTDDVVFRTNKYWKWALTEPTLTDFIDEPGVSNSGWIEVVNGGGLQWDIVSHWVPNDLTVITNINKYKVWNDTLYRCILSMPAGVVATEPGTDSSVWEKIHTLEPDDDITYRKGYIVRMNNRYYINKTNGSILDDGITVYINKRRRNILINITINDKTLNILGLNRDSMYSDEYSKLSAYNFIECLNNINKRNGFSTSVKYVIINQVGEKYEYYDEDNYFNVPVMLRCDKPDQFYSRIKSFDVKTMNIDLNKFKIKRKLDKANIITLDMLNWFNENSGIAVTIDKRVDDPKLIESFAGMSNEIYNNMFRFSGYYTPIFYNIELFSRDSDRYGNYKFDTELRDFGIVKERVVSKVNRKTNILKLKDITDTKSIYPMLDEFGYCVVDSFIFKSNWDDEYFVECNEVSQDTVGFNVKIKSQ